MTQTLSKLPKHAVIMAGSALGIVMIMLYASTAQAQQPYCREQVQHIRIGNRVQEAYGTACLQPDGSWKLVSDVRYNAVPIQNTSYVPPQTSGYYPPAVYAPQAYAPVTYAPAYCPPRYGYTSYYSRPLIVASFTSGYHGRHGYYQGWNGYHGGYGNHDYHRGYGH